MLGRSQGLQFADQETQREQRQARILRPLAVGQQPDRNDRT